MTRTSDPTVERDAKLWPLLAAAIRGILPCVVLFAIGRKWPTTTQSA
jgi:hypothetical protein